MVLSIASYAYEKWGHAAPAEFGFSSPFFDTLPQDKTPHIGISFKRQESV